MPSSFRKSSSAARRSASAAALLTAQCSTLSPLCERRPAVTGDLHQCSRSGAVGVSPQLRAHPHIHSVLARSAV